MKKPIIGITTNTLAMAEGPHLAFERSYVNHDYVDALTQAGAVPLLLPIIADEESIDLQVSCLDAVVISGGPDVNPLLYGEEPSDKLEFINPERDVFELSVIRAAIKRKLPILGICRGLQILNVAFGGTLYQDVAEISEGQQHSQKAKKHVPSHTVEIVPHSKLYALIEESTVFTNSLHHQAIKKLALGFKVNAVAKDGLIEGFEKDGDEFILGVQWHPENMIKTDPLMQKFFKSFVGLLK